MIAIIWKEIPDFEGYYEVSDDGQVRSQDREVVSSLGVVYHLKGRAMKLCKTVRRNADSYYVVNLRKNGRSHVMAVHVLVAMAFIDNPNNLPTVNHKDGNKHNNTVENLEWVSYGENNMHALQMGLRHPRGTEIIQMDKQGHLIATYCSVCEASRQTGIGRGVISQCVNGRIRSAGGYVWSKLSKGCNDYLQLESTLDDKLPTEAQEQPCAEDIVCSL